jgi:hypothetical protein
MMSWSTAEITSKERQGITHGFRRTGAEPSKKIQNHDTRKKIQEQREETQQEMKSRDMRLRQEYNNTRAREGSG